MFGEGVHPGAGALFERKLAPFLTQTSLAFWRSRLWYFQQGLYYQGGMVRPRRRRPRPAPGLRSVRVCACAPVHAFSGTRRCAFRPEGARAAFAPLAGRRRRRGA